jgi:hypothetical protein
VDGVSSNPDYYAQAREIASALSESGHPEWSNQIEEAIAGGSTATEILMRIRFVLREASDAGVTDEISDVVVRLISELDAVLA